MGGFWDLGMDSGQAGSWEGEQRVSRLAGGPVLLEAQVTLQEGRGAALVFQLLFRETTQGGMKVAAAEGLQTELDTRLLNSFGGPTCHGCSPDPTKSGPQAGRRGVRSQDVLAEGGVTALLVLLEVELGDPDGLPGRVGEADGLVGLQGRAEEPARAGDRLKGGGGAAVRADEGVALVLLCGLAHVSDVDLLEAKR